MSSFYDNPRPSGGPAWVAYFLFIWEPEPLGTPSLPTGLAERMLWGRVVGHTPHLVQPLREGEDGVRPLFFVRLIVEKVEYS